MENPEDIQIPKSGEKYYHFKHDPVLGENSHLYEIVGLGDDTETGKILVIYKPLYESKYLIEKGAEYFIRPLSEFFDFVDRDEYQGPRFIKI